MNSVILIGRLTADPFVNNHGIVKIKLATKTGYDKEKQKERTSFVPTTIFNLSNAQIEKLKKGSRIAVSGIVAENSYQKDGQTIYKTEVLVQRFGLTLL